nr:MAG TPA: intron associated endonuclease [Caudoviricetes sp.]
MSTRFRGVIYKYTSPSGRVYVGQTISPKRRHQTFLSSKQRYGGAKLEAARKKYPPILWDYEIIERVYCSSIELLFRALDALEIYYIGVYDSFNTGYNSTLGGLGWLGYVRSADIGKKISARAKKRRISCYRNGVLVKEYPSVLAVSRISGVHSYSIISCCTGKYRASGGFEWCYSDDTSRVALLSNYTTCFKRRFLLQYDLCGRYIRSWNSIKDAAGGVASTASVIQLCTSGRRSSCLGSFWCWSDDCKRVQELESLYFSYLSCGVEQDVIVQRELSGSFVSWHRSQVDAAIAVYGTSAVRGALGSCVRGTVKSYHGYSWERCRVLLKLSAGMQLYIHEIL